MNTYTHNAPPESPIVYNVLVLRGDTTTLDTIYRYYHVEHNKDDGYLFNLSLPLSDNDDLKTSTQYTRNLLGHLHIASDVDGDFNETLIAIAKEEVYRIFADISKRLGERHIYPEVLLDLSPLKTNIYHAYTILKQLRQYHENVTLLDYTEIDSLYDQPDMLPMFVDDERLFNNATSFKRIPEQYIHDHSLLDDQSVYRFDDETLIVALPTMYGPILEVVESIVETYSQIDAELYFGNGSFRGFFEVHDGVTYFGRKEPSKELIMSVLSTIGQEDHLIDFAWYPDDLFEDQDEELY